MTSATAAAQKCILRNRVRGGVGALRNKVVALFRKRFNLYFVRQCTHNNNRGTFTYKQKKGRP